MVAINEISGFSYQLKAATEDEEVKYPNVNTKPQPVDLSSMILGADLVEAGYSIREDDHNVFLDFEGKQLATFTHYSNTEIIRLMAKEYCYPRSK